MCGSGVGLIVEIEAYIVRVYPVMAVKPVQDAVHNVILITVREVIPVAPVVGVGENKALTLGFCLKEPFC